MTDKKLKKEIKERYKPEIKKSRKSSARSVRAFISASFGALGLLFAILTALCLYRILTDKMSILVELSVLITPYTYNVLKPFSPLLLASIAVLFGLVAFILGISVRGEDKRVLAIIGRILGIISLIVGIGVGTFTYLQVLSGAL